MIPSRNSPTAAFHVYLAATHVKPIRDERAGSPFSQDALRLTQALSTAGYRALRVHSKSWSSKIAAGWRESCCRGQVNDGLIEAFLSQTPALWLCSREGGVHIYLHLGWVLLLSMVSPVPRRHHPAEAAPCSGTPSIPCLPASRCAQPQIGAIRHPGALPVPRLLITAAWHRGPADQLPEINAGICLPVFVRKIPGGLLSQSLCVDLLW